jgi:hypothetical protein
MTFQELEDYMAIVKGEQSLGGKDVSDKEVVFYKDGRVIELHTLYAPVNLYIDKECLVIS